MYFLCSLLTVLLLFLTCFKRSQGSILEVTSADHDDHIIGPDIGVYIDSCAEFTFGVKSSSPAYVWLGDGTSNGSYEIVIGGWGNAFSAFRDCDTCSATTQTFSSPDVLASDAFRDIWVSWGDGRVALGRGRLPPEDVIFDIPDPNLHDIDTIGFVGYANRPATYILGEPGKSRFERMMSNGRYTDGEILEDTVSWVNCSQQCHGHPSCGMFSYNDDLARCALFDRMTSSFTLASQSGWKSWRMKYCQ